MEGRQVVHSTYVLIGEKKEEGIGKYAHYKIMQMMAM